MSLLDLVKSLGEEQPQEFIAPVIEAEQVNLFTLSESGAPWTYRLLEPRPGWWLVKPTEKTVARVISGQYSARIAREAYPHEYLSFLSRLPRWTLIACFSTREGVVSIPYNPADAVQRGWKDASPRLVRLVRGNVSPFTVFTAREMAGTLFYDSGRGLDSNKQAYLTELITGPQNTIPHVDSWGLSYHILRQRLMEQRRVEQRKTLAGQLEERLEFAGAKLEGYGLTGDTIDVTYTYNGAKFTVNIAKNMRVYTTPICLNGRQNDFDLSAIVGVMENARKLHRPGIERKDWL